MFVWVKKISSVLNLIFSDQQLFSYIALVFYTLSVKLPIRLKWMNKYLALAKLSTLG
jgi:hypothetical protein